MLRFAEEIMLLLLEHEGEKFLRVPDLSLRYALAGGVLMDLAMEDRIDTDLDRLILVDATPVGDDILDPVLADIASAPETRDARYWVERAAERAGETRTAAIGRLIARGILERREDRFLWVLRARRYPVVDGTVEVEVRLRILEVLFEEVVPTPRDVVIICLADACGLFPELLPAHRYRQALGRIELVRGMDLIGREVLAAISDIWRIGRALPGEPRPREAPGG
ncbi:MAG: GPP34 family phosphoprotein [Gemmatimonadetes bacterium]|nr:GPP34 family phosphoprotein [Gemmatimonadota bacterium]MYI06661.1 GPP34 family phosphoprotein [Gemmatimonadota bacterium]